MKRAYLLSIFISAVFLPACGQTEESNTISEKMENSPEVIKVFKSDVQWKKELDAETYHITREKGTERAFSGKYYKFDEEGIYRCSNCGNPLFKSEHKFESGSGWPSFFTVYSENSIKEIRDNSYGMVRNEVVCARCDAHLGHVFDDGPQPTGMRYCVNSPSLKFEKKAEN